jgi:transcriptional antiterminator RfaH
MEKCLARRFLGRRLAFFLPVYARQWRHRGRLFSSQVPLFPGYIFLHGDHQTRVQALETRLIVACLAVDDQSQLHADLRRVHRLITARVPLAPEQRLRPGTPVTVTQGPLAGHDGRILRRGKRLKFVVEVRFLQRGVSVEIEEAMIQPLAECGVDGAGPPADNGQREEA